MIRRAIATALIALATGVACDAGDVNPDERDVSPPARSDSPPAAPAPRGPDTGIDPDTAAVRDTTPVPDTLPVELDSITAAEAESIRAALPAPSGTAPTPPGGYAIETWTSEGGRLAKIEYVSPKSVEEVAGFYDRQFRFPQRVELAADGETMVAYGLTSTTTVSPSSTVRDIEGLLEQRTEAILVVRSWRMAPDDPLVEDLRDAGQDTQADALLETNSKVIVISRPAEPQRREEDEKEPG